MKKSTTTSRKQIKKYLILGAVLNQKAMKNLIILIIAAFLFSGCSREEKGDDDSIYGVVMRNFVDFSIHNEAGEDLLDPNNPDAYQAHEIEVYYFVDGKRHIYGKGSGLILYQNLDFNTLDTLEYRVGFLLNSEENGTSPVTTYVKWSPTDTDTLMSTYERNNGSVILKKFWYNGELKGVDYQYMFDLEK